MKQADIQTILVGLPDLPDFAKKSKVSIRTLNRIKDGEIRAHTSTLALIEVALKRHRLVPKPQAKD